MYITNDNIGFLRPKFIPSKREKGGKVIYYDEYFIDEKQRDRTWVLLEDFLPNTNGEYTDL